MGSKSCLLTGLLFVVIITLPLAVRARKLADTSGSAVKPWLVSFLNIEEDTSARELFEALTTGDGFLSNACTRSYPWCSEAVNSEANRSERLIQRQETVDAVRTDNRERIKMNEALMELLLRLDSVPGMGPTVRELRRHLSRRIVGLQEILDAVTDERVEDWGGFLRNWDDDDVANIEEEVCIERGGHEMGRFCAENLGFRCLQRFLRDH
ncbi:hypothetical protein F0562_018800 [Nyssa sinensis]|uniref:BAG domain-containing protein n=1 Tax=Nyssa sinensis TaxID=561372 RepID=A0A5J4ZCF7_9ASTE|nr:hypothetical protein F0562_018800 [Nyssa sinensis]